MDARRGEVVLSDDDDEKDDDGDVDVGPSKQNKKYSFFHRGLMSSLLIRSITDRHEAFQHALDLTQAQDVEEQSSIRRHFVGPFSRTRSLCFPLFFFVASINDRSERAASSVEIERRRRQTYSTLPRLFLLALPSLSIIKTPPGRNPPTSRLASRRPMLEADR